MTAASQRYLSSRLITIQRDLRSGAIQTDESKFGFRLKAISNDLEQKQPRVSGLRVGCH